MKKLLITAQIPLQGIKALSDHFDVSYPDKIQLSYDEVVSKIKDFDILLAAGARADKLMLDKAENLKYIANFGVGYDNIDVKYAGAKGIAVSNTPTAVTESTAELAFGLMHAAARRISECDRKLRGVPDLKWGLMQNLGHRLFGKTLGIIGLGRIGRALARRGAAAGMKVIYFKRNRFGPEAEDGIGAAYMSFEELLKNSDFISLHMPFSRETYHMLGENEFKLMKPDAFIINTARGPLIDEKILIQSLREHKIAGAALDVFENEPYIAKEFFELDNVVLTPHIGTASVESRTEMGMEASQNIIDYFIHSISTNVVNLEALKK
jgi:glyoxylate reductase